jgi:hypothetical protein
MKKFLFLFGCLFILKVSVFAETVVLVFKDAQRTQSSIILVFEANGKQYTFDAAKSNLQPFVFYATSSSATVIANEKLINQRFLVNYAVWPSDKSIRYIISIKQVGVPSSSE